MTFRFRTAILAGGSLLLLGASLGTATAVPVAPQQAGLHAPATDQIAYKRRSSRGLRSHSVCGQQPSRC